MTHSLRRKCADKLMLLAAFLGVSFQFIGANSKGCRRIVFNSEIKDRVLSNHTLRTIKPIINTDSCMHKCYMEPLCSSVNYCNKSGETPYCQLIDTDQSRHGADMIDMDGCSFYDTKTNCSSNECPARATCSGDYIGESTTYRCICPDGFEGSNCTQDINECTSNKHNCPKTATCENLHGSFRCNCKQENTTWTVVFDFEDGIKEWSRTGTAFNNQPTFGGTAIASRSKHKGDWWIGSFENRPNSSSPPGGWQGDGPVGTMTSPPFMIRGRYFRFLIGGGCTESKVRVELLVGGKVVAKDTADVCRYRSMSREMLNVSQAYFGKEARLRLVDAFRGKWGHISFDHLEGYFC